jgi:hypothetical protein
MSNAFPVYFDLNTFIYIIQEMTQDETTHLLAKPEPMPANYSEVEDTNEFATAKLSRTFALWQMGALFGNQ